MKKIIHFFSAVKLAIVLIILLVAASIMGTLIPQGRDMAEYAARYGRLGEPLVRLQFTNIFRSVWFLGLMAVFELNIIACTLTRLGAKVQRARKPKIESDPKDLASFKIKDRLRMSAGLDAAKERAVEALKEAHYRVRTAEEKAGNENKSGGRFNVFGRKRIDGIFGSDIVHLGLLVIIAGGILTGIGGFRAELILNPGETKDVPRAGFSVRLERFDTEMYPGGGVKDWKSTVTIVENGRDARKQVIEVNHPLVHKGFSLYQMAYGMNWDAATLTLRIARKAAAEGAAEKSGEASAGPKKEMKPETETRRPAAAQPAPDEPRIIKAKVGEVMPLGDADGTEILVRSFIPDFVLGENNVPESRSLEANNPAAYVEGRRGGKKVVEGWVFAAYPEVTRLKGDAAAEYAIEFRDLDAPQYSVLQAAKDPGVPLIWLGCLLIMAGLILAFYRPTWEIRMVLEAAGGAGRELGASGKTEITAGGVAAKSRDGLEAEFARIIAGLRSSK